MSPSRSTLLAAAAAAVGFAIGSSGLAIAWGPSDAFVSMYMKGADAAAELGNNEGIYVDKATFKLRLGAAKSDLTPQIQKMGGKEVANGAIIARTGNKLYIVDGKPPSD